MGAKIDKVPPAATGTDAAGLEAFLTEHHDEVAVKLASAREQIARGEAAPLEPLDSLLRDARRR